MLAAILLDCYGLRRTLGIELSLEFRPNDGHAQESTAIWIRSFSLILAQSNLADSPDQKVGGLS